MLKKSPMQHQFRPRKPAPVASAKQQHGVVLLEAMVAILIFSVGILGVIGLQAAMIKNTAQASYRATANFIAQEMVGDMWADPTNIANHYVRACADMLPNGNCTAAAGAGTAGRVVVTITWQPPGDVLHNYVLLATITGGTA
jgi:type IV pilus assembly protein PilV